MSEDKEDRQENEIVKRMSFDDIDNKITKAYVNYIFNVEQPLKEVIQTDIPIFAEDKLDGPQRYEKIRGILEMHMSDVGKVFKLIKQVVEQFEQGVK